MGKINEKNCANCKHGERSENLTESDSGEKEIFKYVWCKELHARIKRPEKPCERWK